MCRQQPLEGIHQTQRPWGRRQLVLSEGERKVCSKDGKKLVWLQRSEQSE